MSQAITCIAGAHRSGTSMVTRLLHRCGLYLGLESELMPAAADNPEGFWENLRFVQLNDEVLNTVGAAWDLPPWSEEAFASENLEGPRIKARLLLQQLGSHALSGWKDPRNCLTLPFWRSLVPTLPTVIIVRHPLEVAYSMNKRNGTSLSLGLRLWEIYNQRLIKNSDPACRIVTDYQQYFQAPLEQLQRLAAFIGLPLDAVAEAAQIVTKSQRHTTFTIERLVDAGANNKLVTFYQSLLEMSAAPSAQSTRPEPASDTSSIEGPDRLAGERIALDFAVTAAEELRTELSWRRGAEYQAEKKVETLTRELSSISQRHALEIGRREGRITELQASNENLEQRLREESHERARLTSELGRAQVQLNEQASLRDRLVQMNRQLHAQSIRLNETEARNNSFRETLRKHIRETKRLLRLLEDTAAAAERLRQSRRWFLGNFFSSLGAKLAGRPTPGFGHLDRTVGKFRAWQKSRPEMGQLDDLMASLTPREEAASPPDPSLESASFPPANIEKPITFPQHDTVAISIVIPVFNQVEFTQACLASLQKYSDELNCEVIVVDDCSTDATAELIGPIPGLVYLRSESNAGFIAACNRGAEKARGEYLVFLNNDTTVTRGWLANLLATFQREPDAGLVGSKLVYPDGRLQEAGGIIWRDASGWNRGKFQDAKDPAYNFLREVDYCSAASVMIPANLFRDLGGFDPRYAPAYYEDVDLAFKVRRAGRKVYYQPLSKVVHFEGATGGTDTTRGTKKYQVDNRVTFAKTWATELAGRPDNSDMTTWDALGSGQLRVLVIDHHLPLTDRDAGSVRMFHILTLIRELGHRVTFLPDNIADIPPYGDDLRKRGVEVMHYHYCKSIRNFLEQRGSLFDVVILSRCDFARKHIADVRQFAPQSRVIFDTVDLHHLRMGREADFTSDPVLREAAREKEAQEFELIDQSNETWVVSHYEQELLARQRPHSSIEVVPTIVDVPGSNSAFALRHDFLFIGSFQHSPNADAVLFFANEVFPLISLRLPGVKFYVIGDKAPPSVVALGSENIVITGLQPDVTPYFESVRLSVAPLRFGAGVKGKINQSMGFGVPVVATSLAVEGMSLVAGEDILLADTAADFAEAVIELYQSEPLWDKLSGNGLLKTQDSFSPLAVRQQLARLLSEEHFAKNGAARSTTAPYQAIEQEAALN